MTHIRKVDLLNEKAFNVGRIHVVTKLISQSDKIADHFSLFVHKNGRQTTNSLKNTIKSYYRKDDCMSFKQDISSENTRIYAKLTEDYLVPPENCDVAERNFCVFAQPHNFCHGAQLWQISGCFALIIFHFGEIWGQIGPLSTRNLSFSNFVAECPKLATSCFHTSFHSGCHWARVARLMTLQRSLQ